MLCFSFDYNSQLFGILAKYLCEHPNLQFWFKDIFPFAEFCMLRCKSLCICFPFICMLRENALTFSFSSRKQKDHINFYHLDLKAHYLKKNTSLASGLLSECVEKKKSIKPPYVLKTKIAYRLCILIVIVVYIIFNFAKALIPLALAHTLTNRSPYKPCRSFSFYIIAYAYRSSFAPTGHSLVIQIIYWYVFFIVTAVNDQHHRLQQHNCKLGGQ